MNVALWIIASVLAAAFLVSGLVKVTQPKDKLANGNMAWTQDFSARTVKVIGLLEVLAAIGLILPAAFGVVPVLVPLAAVGLVLIMIGAVITHGRRHEPQVIAVNAVLLILAGIVVWGRFGPYSFTS